MNILKSKNLEKSALKVSNSLLEKKKKISDDRINMLLENLHYKTELDNNQLKLKKAKSRELIIFIISGSAMILLGLIIINYRNRRKTAIREALIHKQKKQLAENELKTKEVELMQMSTFIIEKNELLNTINADLKYHQNLLNNNTDKKSLEPLRKKAKSEINEKADWGKFQKHLFAIHPDFITTLNTEYPNLSTGEIKLCCYLKMNQTTKDIAQWTGLSVRAVENKRYRLRKKLALKKETRLDVFIHGLDIQTV
jgi:DNA-binding CsgD family transcriptional regulator